MLPDVHGRAAGQNRRRPELADVFRSHGESYQRTHRLSASAQKVMRAISVCRTQELGGHLQRCDSCGFERPAYNSCRNRHCPKCQSLAKAQWLEKQTSELLPVGYFHLVFTLPHELNRLILANKKIGLSFLFKAVSETLLEFGQTRLKGTLGIIAVLHTWDQTLKDHFHLHCLVPAGALSFNQSRWISARKSFLFPVKAMSRVFRGKFLSLLQQAGDRGKVQGINDSVKASRQKNWIVYAKQPFGSPRTVLDYLGRYTHRVALSNDRILQVENGQVTLSYRDRRDRDRKKTMTLDAQEFIRRFLLHILPDGFMRIRHFGFLANRSKKLSLARCRKLLDLNPASSKSPMLSAKDWLLKITGVDVSRCPCCHEGTMIVVGDLAALSSVPRRDSS
ncbi:MAG TPA: IS91 family transposase [Candidatus Binatia bacterium]|nr:IS91 family transposase [Candidatus Binatia bacterium]